MNKITPLIIYILISISCFGQQELDSSLEIEEFEFFYTDSIDSIVSYGFYRPTGLISLEDGSIIVSTELSIDFPCQHQLYGSDEYDEECVQKTDGKSHISSGSVIKLNSNLQKEWEIIFNENRIKKINKLPDGSIIIAGQHISMKTFWMAKLDTSGKIIWRKKFKHNYSSNIANMTVDSLGNSYLLAEKNRNVPISVQRHYGKRKVFFFKPTQTENDIYLIKINNNGKVLWKKCLDNKKYFTKYGFQLFISDNVFVTIGYQGFVKQKDSMITQKGSTLIKLNSKGEIINTSSNNILFQYHHRNNNFSCSIKDNSLILYTASKNQIVPTDTITNIKISLSWIETFFTTKDAIYLLDYYGGAIKLDKNNNYINDFDIRGMLIDGIQLQDNSILLLTECYKKATDQNTKSTTYFIISKIKNNKP